MPLPLVLTVDTNLSNFCCVSPWEAEPVGIRYHKNFLCSFPKAHSKIGFHYKQILICSFYCPGAKKRSSELRFFGCFTATFTSLRDAFSVPANSTLSPPNTHAFPRGLWKHPQPQAQLAQVLQLPTQLLKPQRKLPANPFHFYISRPAAPHLRHATQRSLFPSPLRLRWHPTNQT